MNGPTDPIMNTGDMVHLISRPATPDDMKNFPCWDSPVYQSSVDDMEIRRQEFYADQRARRAISEGAVPLGSHVDLDSASLGFRIQFAWHSFVVRAEEFLYRVKMIFLDMGNR